MQHPRRRSTRSSRGRDIVRFVNVFYWDDCDGADGYAFVKLDFFSMVQHLQTGGGGCGAPPPEEEIILPRLIAITPRNVRTVVPDMPAIFDWPFYAAAKSDLVRYAALYHHGGLYLDTDFLVRRDLMDAKMLSKLATSSPDPRSGFSPAARGSRRLTWTRLSKAPRARASRR